MSGGQPGMNCGHPGDDETILKSLTNCPCAASSGALEISLRHRETGTGPEGNFGSLEEEIERSEGNFRTDDGGLGHVEERRLTGVLATQGNLSCECEGSAGVHRSAGQPAFGQRRATAASGTRGNPGCVSAKTGALGEVLRATVAGHAGAATEQSDAERGETGRGPSISCMEGPRRTFRTGQ